MNQSKEKQQKQESGRTHLELKHLTLKPQEVETEITKELINAGIPVISDVAQLPGVMRFDTPHLSNHHKAESFMVVQLPLIVQNEMRDLLERKFPQYKEDGNGVVFFSGHMNADNIFFKKIEEVKELDHLPDVLITNDVNSLYHRFDIINENNFDTFQYVANPAFSGTGLVKPGMVMRYLAVDALVFVVDRTKYEQSAFPREWYELLHPALEKKVVFCGKTDFFCQTIYVHYVRDFGLNALKQLNRNTLETMHPVDMINTLQAGNKCNAKIYVMPYSYARMFEHYIDYQVIWPEDGAIVLPVQMLVKKGAYERNKEIIHLLTSAEAGKVFALNGLIPINRNTDCSFCKGKLNWLGWDFLKSTDLVELKRDIQTYLS
jgi:ABC-type Fe3+ transport system substrate-binding protein